MVPSGQTGNEQYLDARTMDAVLRQREINPDVIHGFWGKVYKIDCRGEAFQQAGSDVRSSASSRYAPYRVPCAITQRFVALKESYSGGDQKKRAKAQELMVRELDILKQTDHENIVKLLGFHLKPTGISLVMPWYPYTLIDLLKERVITAHENNGTRLRSVCRGIAAGVAYLTNEKNILQADLHPGNVLLNGALKVVLIDFGYALRPGDAPIYTKRDDTVAGKIAPELFYGLTSVSKESLAFSLGYLLLSVVCGETAITTWRVENNTIFDCITPKNASVLMADNKLLRTATDSGVLVPWCEFSKQCLQIDKGKRPGPEGWSHMVSHGSLPAPVASTGVATQNRSPATVAPLSSCTIL